MDGGLLVPIFLHRSSQHNNS